MPHNLKSPPPTTLPDEEKTKQKKTTTTLFQDTAIIINTKKSENILVQYTEASLNLALSLSSFLQEHHPLLVVIYDIFKLTVGYLITVSITFLKH